jgi:LuxR family maltose regulon positive regulatory protein
MRHMIELAHPLLATALGSPASQRPAHAAVGGPAQHSSAQGSTGATATGGLLTPKEARILTLLAGGMANKEIARAMDIGEQTVKWHLKNVFFKLNAASRRHAVDRARVLGLLGA